MLTVQQIDEAYRTLLRSSHDPGQVAVLIVGMMQASGDYGSGYDRPLRTKLERHFTEGCSYPRIEAAASMIANYVAAPIQPFPLENL